MSVFIGNFDVACVPKTGSTYLTSFLQRTFSEPGVSSLPVGNRHMEFLPPLTRLTSVRHPASWIRSIWRFCHPISPRGVETFQALKFHDGPSVYEEMGSLLRESSDFPTFVENLIDSKGAVGRLFSPFIEGASVVVHTETMKKDLQELTGADPPDIPLNVTMRPIPRSSLSSKMALALYESDRDYYDSNGYGAEPTLSPDLNPSLVFLEDFQYYFSSAPVDKQKAALAALKS